MTWALSSSAAQAESFKKVCTPHSTPTVCTTPGKNQAAAGQFMDRMR